MQNVHFSPAKLARIFGVNESTIKRWIDKDMLKASKSAGGHRRVSAAQLDEFIHSFPKNAPRSYVLSQYLNAKDTDVHWEKYYTHLLENRSGPAKEILNIALVNRYSLLKQLEQIIQPSLVHIGQQWHEGKISVYQEHRMSFLIRQQLEHLRNIYPASSANGRHAVLACASGDHHEIPLQMCDLLLSERGWETSVLGINIVEDELLSAIEVLEPNMVCISNITGRASSKYVDTIFPSISKMGAQLILGGSGWRNIEENTNLHTVAALRDFVELIA